MVIDMTTAIYDAFDKEYKTPFGAVRQFESCTFTLKFPTFTKIEQPTLVMFRPGYKEKYVQLELDHSSEGYNFYRCTYVPQDLGLHHYYFSVSQNGQRNYIKRKDASIGTFDGNELYQLTVFDKDTDTPSWLKGGVMYQIFPDRFARKAPEEELSVPLGRTLHINWMDTPDWWPNEKGIITNNDFFGGNLSGIEEKLPYLKKLGVTCIYLCPIFESHENHRYSTANYERIDPMLGKEKDFTQLCNTAREMGISIILDGVFSHTGADSIYFNKYGRYGEDKGAFRDPESPYRDWYSFINYPNVYESWWGFDTLPNVVENNPHYTEYICGEGGILQKWIEKGARGWRLDVVDELPDEFVDNINRAVKGMGRDNVVYGEVWEDASNKESYGVRRRYLTGQQLDSVMNYPFKELILNYIKFGNPVQFRDGIMTIIEHYPKPSVDVLMNFLSTHDVERAITRLAGEPMGNHGREWQANHHLSDAEYIYGATLLKCAMVLQFFLPGLPCIYYGDEVGLEGYKDPFNRRTFPWGHEDTSILQFAQELSRVRKASEVFAEGELTFYDVGESHCVFGRRTGNKEAIVYLNKTKQPKRFPINISADPIAEFEILHCSHPDREIGSIKVPPFDYAVIEMNYCEN